MTANGITEKVVSKLLPAEEINERMMLTGGNNTMSFGEEDRNKPPTLAIQPVGRRHRRRTGHVDRAGHRRWPSETAASSAAASDGAGESISIAAQQLGHSTRGRSPPDVARIPRAREGDIRHQSDPDRQRQGRHAGAIQRPRILHADRDANDGRLSTKSDVIITVK